MKITKETLKEARLAKGLTVEAAAKAARAQDARNWYRWEDGTHSISESHWELFLIHTDQVEDYAWTLRATNE